MFNYEKIDIDKYKSLKFYHWKRFSDNHIIFKDFYIFDKI